MPIDRIIDRTDPTLNRVQETNDRGGRGKQQQQQNEKDKDKFEKKPSSSKKILSSGSANKTSVLGGSAKSLASSIKKSLHYSEEEEKSFTLTERILVLWGIIGSDGKPRIGVILTYLLVIAFIFVGVFLIVGMSQW